MLTVWLAVLRIEDFWGWVLFRLYTTLVHTHLLGERNRSPMSIKWNISWQTEIFRSISSLAAAKSMTGSGYISNGFKQLCVMPRVAFPLPVELNRGGQLRRVCQDKHRLLWRSSSKYLHWHVHYYSFSSNLLWDKGSLHPSTTTYTLGVMAIMAAGKQMPY